MNDTDAHTILFGALIRIIHKHYQILLAIRNIPKPNDLLLSPSLLRNQMEHELYPATTYIDPTLLV